MKERKYLAYADNGHEYFSFVFYSEHRANSKQNIADAMSYHGRMYGYKSNKGLNIMYTTLYNCN